MSPCTKCQAVRSPKRTDGSCKNSVRCTKRYYMNLKRAERDAGAKQCMATRLSGRSTVVFCIRGEGHNGKHFDGNQTWHHGSKEPVAKAMASALSEGRTTGC